VTVDLVVIGAGPGGYTAAFRAADLGLSVALVERYERLGGVCLNVGCIPSKELLHVAALLTETQEMAAHGITFGKPKVDLDAVRAAKDATVTTLTGGLASMAKGRKVSVVRGTATFTGPNALEVTRDGDSSTVEFTNAIIAVGSSAIPLPGLPDDPRIVDSTGALALPDIPKRLLVIGGGIIGLEMACVYDALGSRVTVVEMLDHLMPGADPDLVKPLHARISKRYAAIHLGTKVTGIEERKNELVAAFAGDAEATAGSFDRVLVAVGRRPNGASIAADVAGVRVDPRGFIPVDAQLRTNVPHIFAIGDVVGEPMLAHKATHEGKVAAEVIAGQAGAAFDPVTIPNVAYTDPEVAWAGLTETQATERGVAHEVARFPWAASGRALAMHRGDGLTKLIVDPDSRRVLGVGIVGPHAGDLISEAVLALEMGATAEDVALTIHPHPTLSETVGMAADVAEGTVTDLPKSRR
jgi:dihydrolipoamide dehydrogenase